MNIAIMCNGNSEKKTDREDLVKTFTEKHNKVFIYGIKGEFIHPYYGQSDDVCFSPVDASRSNTNPLKEISSIFSVRKKIAEDRIDAAIIYGVKNHAAMTVGARLAGCKNIICVVNGSGNLFKLSGLKGLIVRTMAFPMLWVAYKLSSHVCFQNSDDKELLIKKHILKNNDKIFLTGGSGVNLDKFPRQDMIKENKFLFLARITPTKGIQEYIKAARLVKAMYPDAVFDIVGPFDGITEEQNDCGLSSAVKDNIVTYHGATNDVSGWLGNCRFFVYPSYYPEGVPRCAMQAIATGRPVITCNTPGCKETVIDGVNGFLIEPRNHELLAEKMIWLIEHSEEAESMAVKSRDYAEDKFDVNKINDILCEKLYNIGVRRKLK